jgi:hypothetical protein
MAPHLQDRIVFQFNWSRDGVRFRDRPVSVHRLTRDPKFGNSQILSDFKMHSFSRSKVSIT